MPKHCCDHSSMSARCYGLTSRAKRKPVYCGSSTSPSAAPPCRRHISQPPYVKCTPRAEVLRQQYVSFCGLVTLEENSDAYTLVVECLGMLSRASAFAFFAAGPTAAAAAAAVPLPSATPAAGGDAPRPAAPTPAAAAVAAERLVPASIAAAASGVGDTSRCGAVSLPPASAPAAAAPPAAAAAAAPTAAASALDLDLASFLLRFFSRSCAQGAAQQQQQRQARVVGR